MKKILVTGSCGFIGSHLCLALLAEGYQVTGLDDGSSAVVTPDFFPTPYRHLAGSIAAPATCLQAMTDQEAVIHLAALVSVPESILNPSLNHQVNVSGFFNILEAAKAHHIKRLLFASSAAVYGEASGELVHEQLACRPTSPYGLAKLVNEQYAQSYFQHYQLNFLGFRFFNIYGERQSFEGPYSGVIPRFTQHLLQGIPLEIFGTGEQLREFVYVQDVVQALVLGLKTNSETALNRVYNVGSGQRLRIKQLATLMYRLYCGIAADPMPSQALKFSPPRPGDILLSSANIDLLRQELGYKPAFDLELGLKQTLDWYRATQND